MRKCIIVGVVLAWLFVTLSYGLLDDQVDAFDEFYSNDEYRYQSHRDLKIKYTFVNRDSFPISQASYSTPQLSPSKEVYSIPFNQETIVLITVRNVGRKNFNITHITGYLHAAHSFDFLVENVSSQLTNNDISLHNFAHFAHFAHIVFC